MEKVNSASGRKDYNLSDKKHWGGTATQLYEKRHRVCSFERRVLIYIFIKKNMGTVPLHYLDFERVVRALLEDFAFARSESELCSITIRCKEDNRTITLQQFASDKLLTDRYNDIKEFEVVDLLVQAWMDSQVQKHDNSSI